MLWSKVVIKLLTASFPKENTYGQFDDEYYKDEEGTWIPKKDFWECRTKQEWETGWRIVG